MKRREDIGEMDLWSEKQSTLPPKIDKMKDMTIEITFEYQVLDGAKFLDWFLVKIIMVMNETKFSVKLSGMKALWPKVTCNPVYISWCRVIGTLLAYGGSI